jgi:hypothetical protein
MKHSISLATSTNRNRQGDSTGVMQPTMTCSVTHKVSSSNDQEGGLNGPEEADGGVEASSQVGAKGQGLRGRGSR